MAVTITLVSGGKALDTTGANTGLYYAPEAFLSPTAEIYSGLVIPTGATISTPPLTVAIDDVPSGATVATTFTISPALPTGLSFDQNTGVISGTVTSYTNAISSVTYTINSVSTITPTTGNATTENGTYTLNLVELDVAKAFPHVTILDVGPLDTTSLNRETTVPMEPFVKTAPVGNSITLNTVSALVDIQNDKPRSTTITFSGAAIPTPYAATVPTYHTPGWTLSAGNASTGYYTSYGDVALQMAKGSTLTFNTLIGGAPTAPEHLPAGFTVTLVNSSDPALTVSNTGVLSLGTTSATSITATLQVSGNTSAFDMAGNTVTVANTVRASYVLTVSVADFSFDYAFPSILDTAASPYTFKPTLFGTTTGISWAVTNHNGGTWTIDSSTGVLTGSVVDDPSLTPVYLTVTGTVGATSVTRTYSYVVPTDMSSVDFFSPDNLATAPVGIGTAATESNVNAVFPNRLINRANTSITQQIEGMSFSDDATTAGQVDYSGSYDSVSNNHLMGTVSSPYIKTGPYSIDRLVDVTDGITVGTIANVSVYAAGPVSVKPSVTGAYGTVTWSATGLPAGVTIDSGTGAISGSTSVLGSYTVAVTATDAGGGVSSKSFILDVMQLTISGTPPQAYQDQLFSFTPTIAAPDTSYTVTGVWPTGTGLPAQPADFAVDAATGKLTFTCPDYTGNLSIVLTATDGAQTSKLTLNLSPINYMTATVTIDDASDLYIAKAITGETTVVKADGTTMGTLSYAATGLPTGLSINAATGAITGTPTGSGTSTVTVTATDTSTHKTVTGSVTFTVNPFGVNAIPNQTGYVGHGLKVTPSVTGNSNGIVWSATATSVELGISTPTTPSWMTVNPTTGAITFAPQTTFDDLMVTVTATVNAGGQNQYADSTSFTLASYPNITLTGIPTSATVGTAYSWAPNGSGGKGSLTYSISHGTLPAGLNLNPANGTISGTPTAVGSTSLTITAADGIGTADLAVTINVAGTPSISGVSDISTYVGGTVSVTPSVTGDDAQMTWTIAPALPAGLTLNATTGVLSGKPTATTSSTKYTLTATDAGGGTNSVTFNILVSAVLTITGTAPDGTKLFDYAFTPSVTGGTGNYTFTSPDLTNIGGLTISSSTGAITGTPSTVGSYTFTVDVTDGIQSASAEYKLKINDDLTLTGTPSDAEIGLPFLFAPTLQSRDTAKVSISSGTLPAWLSLDSATGNLSGTPTETGTVDLTLTATNSKDEKSLQVTFYIYAALKLTGTPDAGETYTAYSWAPTATGGKTSAYTYSMTGSSGGLTINPATGVISGTPYAAGTYNVTVTLNDSVTSVDLPLAITVNATPNVQISNSPTTGYTGQAYNWTPTVVNQGSGTTLTVLLLNGSIPTGLTLDAATGTISGTPNTAGVYTFTLNIADGKTSSSRQYVIDIQTPLAISGTPDLGTVDKNYSFSPTAVGGSGSYTFALVAGPDISNFPYSFDTKTGIFSGTPSVAGTYNIAISVNDGATTAQNNFRITIRGKLTLSGVPEDGILDTPYKFTPNCSGGTGTYTFTTDLSLPNGLSFVPTDGSIKGMVSTAVSLTGTITVSDGVDTRVLTVSLSFGDRKTYACGWRLEHFTGWNGQGSPVYSAVAASNSAEANSMGYITLQNTTVLSTGWGWGCLWNNFTDDSGNIVALDNFWSCVKLQGTQVIATDAETAASTAAVVYHCADRSHVLALASVKVVGPSLRVILAADITDPTTYIDTGIRINYVAPVTSGGVSIYFHVTGAGTPAGTITVYSMDSTNKYWYKEGTWSGDLTDYGDFNAVSYHRANTAYPTYFYYGYVTNFDLHYSYLNATVATGVGSVAEWSGDASTFASYPVSYNLTGGYYATQAGQAITLKYGAALTPAVGTEPKVVLMSGAFVTDSSATSAPIEAMVTNTTTSKSSRSEGMFYPNDTGSAHVWSMSRNPDTGKLWTAADLTSLEFGFCRVEEDGTVPAGSTTDKSSTGGSKS